VPEWVSTPQTHSRVLNISLIFDFCYGGGTLLISIAKYIKDGKVLVHLQFQSKVFPGPFTDLSA
jgi:hypothetical protein